MSDAWARAVVPGQMATGAFMRLTAATDATLVDAASPAAKIVEIHEMKMEGGVMKMNAIDKLPLPAGKPVDLKPGGYHVMLMDLTRPMKEGDIIADHADRRRQGGQGAEDRGPCHRQVAHRHRPDAGALTGLTHCTTPSRLTALRDAFKLV